MQEERLRLKKANVKTKGFFVEVNGVPAKQLKPEVKPPAPKPVAQKEFQLKVFSPEKKKQNVINSARKASAERPRKISKSPVRTQQPSKPPAKTKEPVALIEQQPVVTDSSEEDDKYRRLHLQDNDVYAMQRELAALVRKERQDKSGSKDSSDDDQEGVKLPKSKGKTGNGLLDASDDSDDDVDRNQFASPVFKDGENKKHNKWIDKHQYTPNMTEVVEETEPESSFKETKEKKMYRQKSPAPEIQKQTQPETIYEDREDDFSDESTDYKTDQSQVPLKDFTVHPASNDATFVGMRLSQNADVSKLQSIESIREYLEKELGIDRLLKIHPIIRSFGDAILHSDKIDELREKLAHLLDAEKVSYYHQYFATLVFYELEMEDKQGAYNPSKFNQVINCFKDVQKTACFGTKTIGKKY